jgi:hypothetical protein
MCIKLAHTFFVRQLIVIIVFVILVVSTISIVLHGPSVGSYPQIHVIIAALCSLFIINEELCRGAF